jgi:hypothetical protein
LKIEELSPRQICNIAWSMIYDEIVTSRQVQEAAGKTYQNDLAEQIEDVEIQMGLRFDNVAYALEQHKKLLALQGKEWDDTPIEMDWRMQDREIPGTYMGDPNDPARKDRK